jgi:hypothetical protein
VSATTTQRQEPRPYWPSVNTEALIDPIALPRVLAAMGFDHHRGTMARGEITFWRPDYLRHPSWRLRIGESNTIAGRGYRLGEWAEDAIACHDASDAADRQLIAGLNRARRDAPVLIMARNRARPINGLEEDWYLIDTLTGDWRGVAHVSAQQGDDLISLGMLMWQCRFPQAAGRIARAIGLDIPRLADA